MPTRRSLKDSSAQKPASQEGKAASARPSVRGKRVSVHAAAPETETEEKPVPPQEGLASALPEQKKPVQQGDTTETGMQENPAVEDIPSEPAFDAKPLSARPSARGKRASARVAAAPAGEDASSEKEQKKKPTRKRVKKEKSPLRIAAAVLCGVVAALIVVSVAFLVDRWAMHDDAADMQGTWYIHGTSASVPIGSNTIGLSADTSYKYTLDDKAKTITYTIGNLSGVSHYRFSPDRSMVALLEDGKTVFTATLIDDVSWWFSSMGTLIKGDIVLPGPQQSNVVMLSRNPSLPNPVVVPEAEEGAEPDETPENTEDAEESEDAQ